VPPRAVQAALRELFARWGLPERVRVDNGWPWGAPADLPSALALWLIGLGVGVICNRPCRPQENGMVERFHGLVAPWGEPAACPDFAAWQERLDWLVRTQRERYPAVGGRSRLAAYPALAVVGRPYDRRREAARWDLRRVAAYLARGLWPRRVDTTGRITLYHHPYPVGSAHRGRQVFAGFDPETIAWVIKDEAGAELRRHPAAQISPRRIRNLEVSHVKPCQRRRPATQLRGRTAP
jgi:hypothetical protein